MTTHTDKTPIRVSSTHYRIESARKGKEGSFYDLIHDGKRWICNCPDADPQAHGIKYKVANPNCKHRRRLKEYIAEQKARKAGEQPEIAQAQAVADVAQEASLRDEIETLRNELAQAHSQIVELLMVANDFVEKRAVMLQSIDNLELYKRVHDQRIDQLRADLAQETELRQNQTRVWLETSTKQHQREKEIIEALNSQAAEIEQLRNDRKLEISVSVKAPPPHPPHHRGQEDKDQPEPAGRARAASNGD